MKAKEYYTKYAEGLTSDNNTIINSTIKELIGDFLDESIALIRSRKCEKGDSILAVVRELNDKGNSLARMFNPPVLNNNWWESFVERNLPITATLKARQQVRRIR